MNSTIYKFIDTLHLEDPIWELEIFSRDSKLKNNARTPYIRYLARKRFGPTLIDDTDAPVDFEISDKVLGSIWSLWRYSLLRWSDRVEDGSAATISLDDLDSDLHYYRILGPRYVRNEISEWKPLSINLLEIPKPDGYTPFPQERVVPATQSLPRYRYLGYPSPVIIISKAFLQLCYRCNSDTISVVTFTGHHCYLRLSTTLPLTPEQIWTKYAPKS